MPSAIAAIVGTSAQIPEREPSAVRAAFFQRELAKATGTAQGGPAETSDTRTAPQTTVQARRTQLSGTEAAEALEAAWTRLTGATPSRETLSILTAQWAHETGHGASMFNFNFGGIKGTGPSGLTVQQRTREGWGAGERTITDGFRAYQSAEEGATDYVSLLMRRYQPAVEAARRGDAEGFVKELKAHGYFTGNETAYARSVQSMSRAALDRGFDALGSGGGAPRTLAPEPVANPAHNASREEKGITSDSVWERSLWMHMQGFGAPQAPSVVSPLAIAEALDRSALRIVAAEEREPR